MSGDSPISRRPPPDDPRMGRELRAHRVAVPIVRGGVTSGHPLASIAGVQMLLQGGTAADAAVAAMAVLTVVEPWASSAAGNGFTTYFQKSTGCVLSLAFTGAAPLALNPGQVTSDDLDWGILAAVVPGALGGWIAILSRFGRLSLQQVLAPAIDYARNGHPIDASIAQIIAHNAEILRNFPTTADIYLPGGGVPIAGTLLRNEPLAVTLTRLSVRERTALKAGRSRGEALQAVSDFFYKGELMEEFVSFFRDHGGLLAEADFRTYEPRWTSPLHIRYRGYDIYSSPPSSRGGLELMLALNLVSEFDLRANGPDNPDTPHLLIEALKIAKADVYAHVADPDFAAVPVRGLLSEDYAALRRGLIQLERAMPYPDAGSPSEFEVARIQGPRQRDWSVRPFLTEEPRASDTTTLSVVDAEGNALACTPTLGSGFGAGVVIGRTGLLFNNGMRSGATAPYEGHVNQVAPGRKPILNNSPVIVLKDGELMAALGTPGGETIGQTQFQVLVNILDFGMPIQEAIEAPRFALRARPNFYKPGAAIEVEYEGRLAPEMITQLELRGHRMTRVASYGIGSVQAIARDRATGSMWAGADPRRMGYATGF